MLPFSRSTLLTLPLMTATLTLPLVGCGPNTTTTSTGPVTLSLANDKPTWANWFNAVGTYMKNKYQVGFQSQPYSDTSIFQGVVRSAAQTTKAPPLFTWWSGYQMDPIAKAGDVADLTTLTQKWIKNYGLNPDIASAFQVNGRYYGAPSYLAYWVIFYNKHVFSTYDLQPPTTWQEFMQLNATLKSHGVTPLVQYSQDSWTGFIWFENLLVNSDPQLYEDLMVGKVSYTDPRIVKIMQLWKSLEDEGFFGTPENMANPPTSFVQGKTAMNLIGQWYEPTLIQAGMKPGVDFDAFLMPAITSGLQTQLIFETSPIVVSAHSPYLKQALDAVDVFMRPDVQQQWVNATSFVSADSSVPANNSINTQINQLVATQKVPLHNRYWEATPSQIAVPAAADLVQFILHPDSYEQVLQNCQILAQQYWSANQ